MNTIGNNLNTLGNILNIKLFIKGKKPLETE
jgi:hypothetical protein